MGKCIDCDRYRTFDYNIKSLCPYFDKFLNDINVPKGSNPKEHTCGNFKEMKLEEI